MLYIECLCLHGGRALIQCLRRLGPAHCYATSMSVPAVEQVISAMHVLRNKDGSGRGPQKIRQLHDNANYFRQKLHAMGCSVLGSSDSPVMVSPLSFGNASWQTCSSRQVPCSCMCFKFLPCCCLHFLPFFEVNTNYGIQYCELG